MKKSFKILLATAFVVAEFFVIALPIMTTSAKADGAIQAITHAGFGGHYRHHARHRRHHRHHWCHRRHY